MESQQLLETDKSRTMQLISPPPEEELRRGSQRHAPFTPSLLAANSGNLSDAETSTNDTVASRVASASKRKRAKPSNNNVVPSTEQQHQQLEATPNPKPRKQLRRHQRQQSQDLHSPTKSKSKRNENDEDELPMVVAPTTPSRQKTPTCRITLQSPHARNPDADYIPPINLRMSVDPEDDDDSRDVLTDLNTVNSALKKKLFSSKSHRRSVTPIPPYEPPQDVFTPPREVILSPPAPPSSSRKKTASGRKSGVSVGSKARKKAGSLTPIVVKQEMPEVDLSAPMPPASPTDDPLLLSSDIEITGYNPAPSPPEQDSDSDNEQPLQFDYQAPLKTPERPKRHPKQRSTTSKRKTPGSVVRKGKTVSLETTSVSEAAQIVLEEELGVSYTPSAPPRSASRTRSTTKPPPSTGKTPSNPKSAIPSDLPPSSPPPESDDEHDQGREALYDWTKHTQPMTSTEEDSMMQIDSSDAAVPPVPLFDFDAALRQQGDAAANGWESSSDSGNDSDDLDPEGRGQYTGRFRMLKVRTKEDPPSEATLERMELWGRPVSPFPDIGRLKAWSEGKVPKELALEGEGGQGEGREEEGTRTDGQREGPGEEENELPVAPEEDIDVPIVEEPHPEDEAQRMSLEPEEQEPRSNEDHEQREEEEVEKMSMETEPSSDEGEQEEEAEVERMSMEPEEDEGEGNETEKEEDRMAGIQVTPPSDESDHQTQKTISEPDKRFSFASFTASESRQSPIPEPQRGIVSERHQSPQRSSPQQAQVHSSPRQPQSSPYRHEESYYDTVVPLPQEEEEATQGDRDIEVDDHAPEAEISVKPADDDDDLSDFGDLGVVKIVSADPRAAARAAAILKQHDYECFTKVTAKQRKAELKRRHSSVDSLAQESRRRSLLGAGIDKNSPLRRNSPSGVHRRRSMGVIGERVIIPGSPAITLPELLEQVEKEVVAASPNRMWTPLRKSPGSTSLGAGMGMGRDPFVTPVRQTLFPSFTVPSAPAEKPHDGPRAWTKEEWKLLDGCFTDERYSLVEAAPEKYPNEEMAPVEDVETSKVVDRFVSMMGGEDVIKEYGDAWDMERLEQRVLALQKKQRKGNVAPPSTPRTSEVSNLVSLAGMHRRTSMDVPDFTPLGRGLMPPRKPRGSLGEPLTKVGPRGSIPKGAAPLLAPRYSHLLDEAMVISSEVTNLAEQNSERSASTSSSASSTSSSSGSSSASITSTEVSTEATSQAETDTSSTLVDGDVTMESAPSAAPSKPAPVSTPSLGTRLKSTLFSYLPTLSRNSKPKPSKIPRPPAQPGLPLPPPPLVNYPRPPITTPARPPQEKPPHPKELVDLHPVPDPEELKKKSKPSMIPRPVKRLVELNPVTPPDNKEKDVGKPRRSSTGSVKDLIRSFEEMEKERIERERAEGYMSRPSSSLSMGRPRSQVGFKPGFKPVWRP
ncbi:hypothetical protein CC1G_09905 [Coprinopsis cinerea okayama7|uniref:Uncharacterized protein n=1 Tax=Coprinopsis cinerea (strain Okayama-7 / 130 / ATCC MYA-4618 / FGSC 9003) TaxID=240176 RepID=A8NMY7_COPC7|nr:hypothetical protein CC1G_09905 [Coprinopsis cinerea okayama7\|eukprot:XP_001835014.2 hypothetical protein CC1G_09905 [Coprinopsis cinerea okayama7\